MRAEVASFLRDITGAAQHVSRSAAGMQGSFGGLGGSLTGVMRHAASLRTTIAGLVGAGGLSLLVSKSVDAASAIHDMAIRTGLGIEALQEMQHAARQSGVSTEELETGLRNLNRRIGEAAAGEKEAVGLFRDLGISATESGGRIRATEDVLGDLADRLSAIQSPAERTKIAMEAFGRSGTALLPMLAQGRAGLNEMAQEARRMGLVIDAEVVQAAERAGDKIGVLASVIRINLLKAIGEFVASDEFAQWVQRVTAGISDLVRGAKDLGLLPSTTSDNIGRITERIRGLEKEISRIERGEGIGDRINRFFGQTDLDRARLARMRQELADLEEVQRGLDELKRSGMTLRLSETLPVFPERADWEGMLSVSERLREAAEERKRLADAAELAPITAANIAGWVAHAESVLQATEQEQLALVELADKAAAESARFRELDFAGWVAHAEAVIAETEREQLALVDIADKTAAANERVRERARELDFAGWVAHAEAVIAETEREQLAIVKIQDEAAQRRALLVDAIADPIDRAFSSVGDAIVEMAVRGEDAMISLGNIARGVVASILSDLIRTGLIRPAAQALGAGIAGLFGPGGGGSISGANLGGQQHGGIFKARPGGWIRRFAEGGQDEAVMPLNRLYGMMAALAEGGGRGGVTIINQAPGVEVVPGQRRGVDGRELDEYIVRTVNRSMRGGRFNQSLGQIGLPTRP